MKRTRFEKIIEKRQKSLRVERKVTVMRKWIELLNKEILTKNRRSKIDLNSMLEQIEGIIQSVKRLPLDEQETIKKWFNLEDNGVRINRNILQEFEDLFEKLNEIKTMTDEEISNMTDEDWSLLRRELSLI